MSKYRHSSRPRRLGPVHEGSGAEHGGSARVNRPAETEKLANVRIDLGDGVTRGELKAAIRDSFEGRYADLFDKVDKLTAEHGQVDAETRKQIIDATEEVCIGLVDKGMLVQLSRNRWQAANPAPGLTTHPSTTLELAKAVWPLAFTDQHRIYRRWEDAMIEQLRLASFTASHLGRAYCNTFERSLNTQHPPSAQVPAGMLHHVQTATLDEAEPVYIGADVCELVEEARWDWTIEPVHPSNPFTEDGFCLLARPIPMPDAPWDESNPGRGVDGVMMVRAIAWLSISGEDPEQGVFWISFYCTHEDDDGHIIGDYRVPNLNGATGLVLGHTFQWTWGSVLDERKLTTIAVPGEDMEAAKFRARIQTATVQTLWRLGQQFVPVPNRLPRALRRDAKRRMKRDIDNVNVVVLRRAYNRDDGNVDTDRHYTCTFIVGSYWAIRHTKDGPRQTRVKGHLKGQGPFRESRRVWEFTR